jgi:tetratricopeptide (TPR) repeat protein
MSGRMLRDRTTSLTRVRKMSKDNPRRREPRVWRLPPAILRGVGETLEGGAVLEDFEGETALRMWRAVRDVRLWAELEPNRRSGLFRSSPTTRPPTPNRDPNAQPDHALDEIAAQLEDPATADGQVLASACLTIARFAEYHGRILTAVLFAITASLAAQERAAPAYEAGRLALLCGDLVRAETWLLRALGLARRSEDWLVYCRAHVALGDAYTERADVRRAERHYTAAMRAGRRYSKRETRGMAAFGLMRLSIGRGEYARAEKFGMTAHRSFGADHEKAPAVGREMARISIELGDVSNARNALWRLLAGQPDVDERITLIALLVRAEVNPKAPSGHAEAWHRAWSMLEMYPHSKSRDRALVDLALAGMVIGDAIRARAALIRVSGRAKKKGAAEWRDVVRVEGWLNSPKTTSR